VAELLVSYMNFLGTLCAQVDRQFLITYEVIKTKERSTKLHEPNEILFVTFSAISWIVFAK